MKKLILAACLVGIAWAAPQFDFPPQIEIRVASAPSRAPLVDGDRLIYELLVCNHQPEAWDIEKVEILDQDSKTLLDLAGLDLDVACKPFGGKPRRLPPGASLCVFCYAPSQSNTTSLRHRVTFSSQRRIKTLETESTAVLPDELPVLSNPFGKAGMWNAASAPSNSSVHRRTMMTLNGHFHISQRFAIDWVLTDDQHRFFRGEGAKKEDHYCYGVPALAVADGTVVDLQDGLAEAEPSIADRPYPISPRTIGGNWVALQIAPHRYAMYAHMQPGSIAVHKGDKIKRGQVVGKVGNSGNTTAPHLHLHVADRPDWIDAEGMPYVFEHFRTHGLLTMDEDEKHTHYFAEPHGDYKLKMPTENALLEFE